MKKEIINFDLAKGVKVFDTSKMEEWTDDEWKAFIGDPTKDIEPWHVLLVDDDELRLEIVNLYFNDFDEYIIVILEACNKLGKDVAIQFNQWRLDNQYFDLSSEPLHFVAKKSNVNNIKISVNYLFFDTMTLEVNIVGATTSTLLREFEFNIVM